MVADSVKCMEVLVQYIRRYSIWRKSSVINIKEQQEYTRNNQATDQKKSVMLCVF